MPTNAQAQGAPDAVPDADLKAEDARHPPPADAVPDDAYATDTDYAPAGETTLPRLRRLALGAGREIRQPGDGTVSTQPVEKTIEGMGENALASGTGLLATAGGGLAGAATTAGELGRQALQGQPLTLDQAVDKGAAVSRDVQGWAYQPRSEMGKLQTALMASPLELMSEFVTGPTGAFIGRQMGNEAAGRTIGEAAPAAAAALFGRKPVVEGAEANLAARRATAPATMPGVGAATSAAPSLRQGRADALELPPLTQAQRTRDPAAQHFERETAKEKDVGAPLRDRFTTQNHGILSKMDAWFDETGAEAGSLRAVGQVVNDAVVAKANRAKSEVRTAYKQADAAGATQEKINVKPLQDFLAEHQDEAELVNVLRATDNRVTRMASGGRRDIFGQTGQKTMTIKQLETVRKIVNRLGQKDPTEMKFAGDLRRTIDAMTEGKGGKEYRQARGLRAKYAREFEDVGVIDRLMSQKPGTKDRSVAYEDVFQHSILKGSLDDVRHVRRTLQTAGDDGRQAWKELQGATINHLKDEVTKGVTTNERGEPVISAARLNTLVRQLDQDGKLDFIFGKKAAQQVRDLNEYAKDALTSPPAAGVNYSNTASTLLKRIDYLRNGVLSSPIVRGIHETYKRRQTEKRVQETLQ